MRKILRNIARYNMKQAGITRMNRRAKWQNPNGTSSIGSFFSFNWRNYLQPKRRERKAA